MMWMISLETPTALFFEGFLRGFEAQNWELEPHLLLVRPQLDACWRGLLFRAHPSCCFFAPLSAGCLPFSASLCCCLDLLFSEHVGGQVANEFQRRSNRKVSGAMNVIQQQSVPQRCSRTDFSQALCVGSFPRRSRRYFEASVFRVPACGLSLLRTSKSVVCVLKPACS